MFRTCIALIVADACLLSLTCTDVKNVAVLSKLSMTMRELGKIFLRQHSQADLDLFGSIESYCLS